MKNSNTYNILLLKCVLDELPKDGSYDDVMNKMEDIKETIREVIESLENGDEDVYKWLKKEEEKWCEQENEKAKEK